MRQREQVIIVTTPHTTSVYDTVEVLLQVDDVLPTPLAIAELEVDEFGIGSHYSAQNINPLSKASEDRK